MTVLDVDMGSIATRAIEEFQVAEGTDRETARIRADRFIKTMPGRFFAQIELLPERIER